MRHLTDREIIARLEILGRENPQNATKISKIQSKFRIFGYVSENDAKSLGLKVRLWTRNGGRGFYPQRGDTCQPVHFLSHSWTE
jgi:hypothetical protein